MIVLLLSLNWEKGSAVLRLELDTRSNEWIIKDAADDLASGMYSCNGINTRCFLPSLKLMIVLEKLVDLKLMPIRSGSVSYCDESLLAFQALTSGKWEIQI